MLDGVTRRIINRPLDRFGHMLAGRGVTANAMTLAGLLLGLGAAIVIACGLVWIGLALIAVSRLADGLDGAVARATRPTDFGGYWDIAADFIFYGAIPLGFAILDPAANAVPAAVLLFAFYANGGSFLGFAVLAERRGLHTERSGQKTLFYADGLMEGTETIGFFLAFCFWPHLFGVLAYTFAALTFYTAIARLFRAWRAYAVQT